MGAAFSWGWKKFTENIGVIAIAILVWALVVIVFGILGIILQSIISGAFSSEEVLFGTTYETGPGFFGAWLANAGFQLLYFVAYTAGAYGLIRAVLAIAEGREVTTSDIFDMSNFTNYLLTAVLVGLATTVGFFLCIIPGFIAWFLFWLAPFYAADKNMSPVDAMKQSMEVMTQNTGPMILFFLGTIVATMVGAVLCLVGLLVAVPVIYLAGGYMYKTVNNEPVAP